MKSPILGLGWGSVVSHDLVMNLLSNAGIIGLISFLAFVVVVSRGLLRSIKSSYFAEEKCWKIAIALSFFTLLLINVFTGFAFVFGHLWLTVGLAMSASVLKYERPARAVAAGGGDQ
jgi:O-antigen ligase